MSSLYLRPVPKSAVLLSGGLDSVVLLALERRDRREVLPIHVRSGFAWEAAERRAIDRVLAHDAFRVGVAPLRVLDVDMRDIYPASHWAVAGQPPLLGLHYDAQAALAEDPALTAIREVTLSLEVPQVLRSEQPYVRLREAAARLAEVMDGQLTDDNGQPLTADAMDLIGAELENLYDRLDARELSAGSALARRLFS